jgi:hypothetical protein
MQVRELRHGATGAHALVGDAYAARMPWCPRPGIKPFERYAAGGAAARHRAARSLENPSTRVAPPPPGAPTFGSSREMA